MSKLNEVVELKTKRFVIRKSLIGKNTVINKCELVYNCEQWESAVYLPHNNNNIIKFILLQCKYEM